MRLKGTGWILPWKRVPWPNFILIIFIRCVLLKKPFQNYRLEFEVKLQIEGNRIWNKSDSQKFVLWLIWLVQNSHLPIETCFHLTIKGKVDVRKSILKIYSSERDQGALYDLLFYESIHMTCRIWLASKAVPGLKGKKYINNILITESYQ